MLESYFTLIYLFVNGKNIFKVAVISTSVYSHAVSLAVCTGRPTYIFTVFISIEFCFHIQYKLCIMVYRQCVNTESCIRACICVCLFS